MPAGVELVDAASILPKSMIFNYEGYNTPSAFSNLFRYRMLYRNGGYWVDGDVICLKPFDFLEDYVIAAELHDGKRMPTSCVLKAPVGSQFMKFCFEQSCQKDRAALKWGDLGPKMVAAAVRHHRLQNYVKSHLTFCPLPYQQFRTALFDDFDCSRSHGVHLWHEMWRRNNLGPNSKFQPNCLYERLREEVESQVSI